MTTKIKIFKKQVFTLILFITAFQLSGTHAQVLYKISPVLDLNLPDSSSTGKSGYINTCAGGDSLESYEATYFDTIVVKIKNEEDFNLALKSFVAGRFAGDGFKLYDLLLTDTLIGNLPGLFITGVTNDTKQEVTRFYCFVTIANSNSYWFYYYLSIPSLPTKKAGSFFSAIQFDSNKIKEAAFKISSFKKHKVVGKTWYISPELDYPMPPKEVKKEKEDEPWYMKPPPPPPIRREWIVKAGKLAADYSSNRSLADKKYKKGSVIVIEGIVKEIKETDENGITVIILNGAPSKINIQCQVLNSRKLKGLKKGMKATFNAHCDGINGDVILSGCIYIEKPTYE